ncbi:MAG: hypothetical protein CSB23_02895 [Deltaproteobacteria bacterium]|nr:MAG: hypothetical protein CSB23_02895 [Deltaproteobacteria bacterium]
MKTSAQSDQNFLLEAKNVSRSYGWGDEKILALQPLSLRLQAGEFLFVCGPSGVGKSTFLHLLSGLDSPSQGEVFFAGLSLQRMSSSALANLRNRAYGFIFQTPYLLADKTVFENITLPFHYGKAISRELIEFHCMALLKFIGLEELAQRYPATLSGGEMQRVVFARALVREPQVIFADEPTGNLDSENSLKLVKLLREQADLGRIVVMVSHDAALEQYATRVLRLDKRSSPGA